ncbi:hypothetical protein [Sporosarcina sp. FA9]|uniref:hypothetical protein n=1 Tax=Sporosarcina sp. FA9 TaxID=3413030 RepID=UPI003F65C731
MTNNKNRNQNQNQNRNQNQNQKQNQNEMREEFGSTFDVDKLKEQNNTKQRNDRC